MKEHVRSEYRKFGNEVARSDFLHIEHLLRRGEKQLKMLKREGVDKIHYRGPKGS